MQRNGKTPQGAATTTQPQAATAQLPPMTLLDTDSTTQDAASTPQSPALTTQAADTSAQPTAATPRRRMGGLRAGAGIEARLVAAQLAIDTVVGDPGLQAIMAAYGYDAARMRQGQALREQALALYQQQRAALGERFAATDAHASTHAQAHAIYMRHVAIARVALRGERGAAKKLDLATARKRTQAGWLIQAQQFYANTLGDSATLQKLAAYGVAREQLADAQRMVAAVAGGLVAQQATTDAAQALTRDRDAALAALSRWMRDFRAIARVALADQPLWQG
jgi:hypothetical protein